MDFENFEEFLRILGVGKIWGDISGKNSGKCGLLGILELELLGILGLGKIWENGGNEIFGKKIGKN